MSNVAEILDRARRRWVAARVVEWSAVSAVAAAAGALPVLAAWSVAYRFAGLAAALCVLPLAAAVVVVARPLVARASRPRVSRASRPRNAANRQNIRYGQAGAGGTPARHEGETPSTRAGETPAPHGSSALRWLVAGVLLSVFAGGLAGVLWGVYLQVPRAAWLVHVAVSAAAGAVVAMVCRPDVLQTARRLDERLGLRERLSTSSSLLSGGRPDADAMSRAVVSQAAEVAEARGVRTTPMWTLGRPTAGALCLAVLACLVVLLAPAYGPGGAAGAFEGLAVRVEGMSAADLERLAEALRNTAAADGEGTRRIHEAAAAAEAGDKELLAQSLAVLAKLIEEGKLRLVKLPSALVEDTLRDDPGGDGEANGGLANANAAGNAAAGQTTPTNNADTVTADQTQLVFHPDYSRLTNAAAANPDNAPPNGASTATAQPSATYMSFDQAWDHARARASQSLTDGDIPPNRRQVVREFFRAP